MRGRGWRFAAAALLAALVGTSALRAGDGADDDPKEDHRIAEALSLLRSGKHLRASTALQSLVESEHAGREIVSGGKRRFMTLRARALQVLASMPPDALRAYRATVDPVAGRLYARADRLGDEEAIAFLAERYLCSSVGDDALDRLGNLRLDRGDLVGALGAWRRLLEDAPPGRRPHRPTVAAKAMAVAALLDRSDLVEALRSRVRGMPTLRLPTSLRPAAEESAGTREPRELRCLGYAVIRKTVPGGGRGPWPLRTRPTGVLPAASAVLAGGDILTRDGSELITLDAYEPGRISRRFPVPPIRRPGRGRTVVFIRQSWTSLATIRDPAWVDVAAGAVAAGEGLAIITSDSPGGFVANPAGFVRVTGDGVDGNRLLAYDLQTGRPRWVRGDPDDLLYGGRFTAVPVIENGRAYVPLVRGLVFHVVALDLTNGQTAWSTAIGTTTLDGLNRVRRSDASPVTLHEDRVYVVTNSGRAACLDRKTGDVRWIRSLPRTFRDQSSVPWTSPPQDLPQPAAPIVARGRVVFVSSDSNSLVCLDTWNGKTLWHAPIAPESNHLVGVAAGRVVVGGAKLRAFDLEGQRDDERLLWERSIRDPSGRGCIVGRHVYVPSGHRILRFPLADGEPEDGEVVAEADAQIGNLIPRPNGFLGVNVDGVGVFLDVAAERREAASTGQEDALAAALERVEAREIVRPGPAAVGDAATEIRRAKELISEDPGAAYDLARRIERRYPESPAAAPAMMVAHEALAARKLSRDRVGIDAVRIGFPLRHVVTFAGELSGLVRLDSRGTVGTDGRAWFYLVRGGPAALHCVKADGKIRWSGLMNPTEVSGRRNSGWQQRCAPVVDRDCIGALDGDKLIVGTNHAFYWLKRSNGSVDSLRAVGPGRDDLARFAMQANFHWMARQQAIAVRAYDRPCRLLARGVAVQAYAGQVRGFRDGQVLWEHPETGRILGGIEAFEDRFLVTRLGPTRVIVRRLDTGIPTAEITLPGALPSGPARFAGDAIVTATDARRLTAHDAYDGVLRWSVRLPEAPRRIVHADERSVVVLLADGRLTARAAKDGAPLWTASALEEGEELLDAGTSGTSLAVWAGARREAAGLRMNGPVWRVNSSSYLHVFDLRTGRRAWDRRTIQASPPYSAGRLVLTSRHAILPVTESHRVVIQAVRLRDGELEDPVRIDGKADLRPAEVGVATDMLLVTTKAGVSLYRGTSRGGKERR